MGCCRCYQNDKEPRTKVTVYEGEINGIVYKGISIYPMPTRENGVAVMKYTDEQLRMRFGTSDVSEIIDGWKEIPCKECFAYSECDESEV